MDRDRQWLAGLMRLRARRLLAAVIIALLIMPGEAPAAFDTVVPISAELATGIAGDLFPVTLKLSQGNVFLTAPQLLFSDPARISLQVRFQAYDHRPQQNIAISETGHAVISGRLGYDRGTRQVLLYDARIDKLQFDNNNAVTERLSGQLQTAWSSRVTNPIRADVPPHPYLMPFKNNIQGLSYDGKNISLTLSYE